MVPHADLTVVPSNPAAPLRALVDTLAGVMRNKVTDEVAYPGEQLSKSTTCSMMSTRYKKSVFATPSVMATCSSVVVSFHA